MKRLFSLLIALGLSLAAPIGAHAQVLIAWGSAMTLTGDSNILTNGTYFDAVNSAQGGVFTDTVVEGITIHGLSNYAGGINGRDGTDGYVTLHSDGGNFLNDGQFTAGSAAFNYAVNNGSDANNGSVTIGNATHPLISGHVYQVEVIDQWQGPYGALVNGNPSVALNSYGGSYAVGTFTANAISEIFTYGGRADTSGHAGFVNDVIIEDLGAVPEPGTWAMMVGGLGALALVVRTRRAFVP